MSEFVVYGLDGSPFVRAVEIVLIEKGAKYRLERIRPQEAKRPSMKASLRHFLKSAHARSELRGTGPSGVS